MSCRFTRLSKDQADYLLYRNKRQRHANGIRIKKDGFFGSGKVFLDEKTGWRYPAYRYNVIVDWKSDAVLPHILNLITKFIRHIEENESLPKQKSGFVRASSQYIQPPIENVF